MATSIQQFQASYSEGKKKEFRWYDTDTDTERKYDIIATFSKGLFRNGGWQK